MRPATIDAHCELLLDSAAGLHASGHETSGTIRAVSEMSGALGLPVTIFPRWGEIILQTEAPMEAQTGANVEAGRTLVRIRSATPSSVAMNRVAALMRIVERVSAGGGAGAARAIADVERLPPSSLLLFALACAAGASALAIIFGANRPEAVAVIAVSSACAALLRRLLARFGGGALSQAFAAALLAGLVGALAVRWHISSELRLVAVCQAMILVPGPHILNGAMDMLELRIPLGASRLAFASMILLAIWIGLLLGLRLLDVSLPVSEPGPAVALWLDVLAAGVAAACYGVFFSMPLRMLAWPVLVGMLAHGIRWWAITAFQMNTAFAAGLACLVVGTILVPVARQRHLPFAAIGFAAVVALIPGVFTFRLASGLIELQAHGANVSSLTMGTLADGVTAILSVIAMALGLAIPKRLYDMFASRHMAQHLARA
jgi:uncharacterized membrane protein YjjB (DUF3815 family)